jgi:hypothetical protein
LTCPTPCTNITPCISVVHPNCQTPFVPCLTPACTGPVCAGPAAQARALPTMFAHCTQVCTQMQMGCGGQGCPGGTIM